MIVQITYDLHRERNYAPLYRLLASWKAVRVTESFWLANLTGPAETIRNIVAGALDRDDSVVVTQLPPGSDWATLRVNPAAEAFLSAYVTPAKIAA